jgi:hypothetical protein
MGNGRRLSDRYLPLLISQTALGMILSTKAGPLKIIPNSLRADEFSGWFHSKFTIVVSTMGFIDMVL